jgi:hypothetical protein
MIIVEPEVISQEQARGKPMAVAYGGGTNSTALLVALKEAGMRPSFITFSDTGGERDHTYQHIEAVQGWLRSINFPAIEIVRKTDRQGNVLTLEQDCLSGNRLPSIVYGYKTCSQKFKIQPQDKWFNNNPEAKEIWRGGEKIIKLIGYDADEERRVKHYPEDKKYSHAYPLVHWFNWDRDDCVDAIKRAGLPQPGKSACFFCPSSKKTDILDLAKHEPEKLIRAIAIEDNAKSGLTSITGLGRRFAWRELAETGGAPGRYFWEEEMPCDCYDGEPVNDNQPISNEEWLRIRADLIG